MTYVLWCEDLWNVGVLRRVHLSRLVICIVVFLVFPVSCQNTTVPCFFPLQILLWWHAMALAPWVIPEQYIANFQDWLILSRVVLQECCTVIIRKYLVRILAVDQVLSQSPQAHAFVASNTSCSPSHLSWSKIFSTVKTSSVIFVGHVSWVDQGAYNSSP